MNKNYFGMLFAKYLSWKKRQYKFCKEYPISVASCKKAMYRIVQKFCVTGLVLDKMKI